MPQNHIHTYIVFKKKELGVGLICFPTFPFVTRPFCPLLLCSVTQSCPTLCDPTDCSTPGLPAPHHLLKFAQVHIHCIGDAIQPSHPLMPSSPSALKSFPASGTFPMSQLFASDDQKTGVSASASVLPISIQG